MVQMSEINHISGAQGSAVMCASTPNVIWKNRLTTSHNLEKYFHGPHPSGGSSSTRDRTNPSCLCCIPQPTQLNQMVLEESYDIRAGDNDQQGAGRYQWQYSG